MRVEPRRIRRLRAAGIDRVVRGAGLRAGIEHAPCRVVRVDEHETRALRHRARDDEVRAWNEHEIFRVLRTAYELEARRARAAFIRRLGYIRGLAESRQRNGSRNESGRQNEPVS